MYRLAPLLYPRSSASEAYRALRPTSSSRQSTLRSGPSSSRAPSPAKARPSPQPTWRSSSPRRVVESSWWMRISASRVSTSRSTFATRRASRRCWSATTSVSPPWPTDRGGEPACPHDGAPPPQPGRTPGLAAHACHRRPVEGRRGPDHRRQPAAAGRHRCGDPRLVPRWNPSRHRRFAKPPPIGTIWP